MYFVPATNPSTHGHGYGLMWGCEVPTRTPPTRTRNLSRVGKPLTVPKYTLVFFFPLIINTHWVSSMTNANSIQCSCGVEAESVGMTIVGSVAGPIVNPIIGPIAGLIVNPIAGPMAIKFGPKVEGIWAEYMYIHCLDIFFSIFSVNWISCSHMCNVAGLTVWTIFVKLPVTCKVISFASKWPKSVSHCLHFFCCLSCMHGRQVSWHNVVKRQLEV